MVHAIINVEMRENKGRTEYRGNATTRDGVSHRGGWHRAPKAAARSVMDYFAKQQRNRSV